MQTTLRNIALALGVTTLFSCGGAEGTKIEKAGEKVEATTDAPAAGANKSLLFKVNETIKLGDYVITVTKVVDNAPAPDDFNKPEAGKKFVALEVLYENRTSDKQLTYNPFDWKISDGDGYNYEGGMSTAKEPALHHGTLNPGQKSKGWITFETGKDAKGLKAQFQPDWISNENVEVVLE